jgi:aryl-alcohol dehydrogenase-like predicted oxidoreductase
MKYRTLGKTGIRISEISLGTWQLGGGWGAPFDESEAEKLLESSFNEGINFIDTADVYSDGMSEAAVGRFVKKHPGKVTLATKCGRKVSPHLSEGYTPQVLRGFVEDSLRNTGLEQLDLIQLHCPPT